MAERKCLDMGGESERERERVGESLGDDEPSSQSLDRTLQRKSEIIIPYDPYFPHPQNMGRRLLKTYSVPWRQFTESTAGWSVSLSGYNDLSVHRQLQINHVNHLFGLGTITSRADKVTASARHRAALRGKN